MNHKRRTIIIRRVVGKSMQPVLQPGSFVVASGYFFRVAPEAVVIVRHNGLEKIKRIEKIRDGKIFVVGDNLRASLDSRSFGWLPLSSVVAKVIWPRV